jgi:hypothetical protein
MSARRTRVAGMTCPRCKQPAYRMSDGTLSEHRTAYNIVSGSRRERCTYSGGTVIDARLSIPPLMRRTQAYLLRRQAKGGTLSAKSLEYLAEIDRRESDQ